MGFIGGVLNKLWWRPNLASYLLWPFSLVYDGFFRVRKFTYRVGLKTIHRFEVPVIIVGNLSVGGTGKTPVVSAIARRLRDCGWKPGIVSRGYGGRADRWPQAVSSSSSWELVGDEPVMLARQTGCPLVVGPDRAEAVRELLASAECDLVIADDGLQHLALGRDVEIVVVDIDRGFGNGFCLPAGPLREPVSRLNKVDFVVYNGSTVGRGVQCELLGDMAINLANPGESKPITGFGHRIVHAVAGIGNPARFFTYLKDLGLNIEEHAFPDHHRFSAGDLGFSAETILMTEKDAIKCLGFATARMWYLPVEAKLDDSFYTQLNSKLKGYDRQKIA